MCGIAGIVTTATTHVNTQLLTDMMQSLAHRGPDFQSQFTHENVGLAHTRLKIQDLSDSANQPFVSNCGNYILVYNGEIYNHQALRNLLSEYTFKTHSDTETLLAGLIYFQNAFIDKLNGIFAFAFYNKLSQKILLARDRYGVKPLYYIKNTTQFAFASEIKALKIVSELPFTTNEASLADYTNFLSCCSTQSPYNEVFKLEMGSSIELDILSLETQTEFFFKIPTQRTYITDSEQKITETTHFLLKEAVERQLVADVPLGFFLSGGLDSSLLVAIAKKLRPTKAFTCFTLKQDTEAIGFENDYPYAQLVANHLEVTLRTVQQPLIHIENKEAMIDIIEEPIYDLSAINVLAISKIASLASIKVLVSGLGADEVFSGYRRHQVIRYHTLLKYLPLKSSYTFLEKIGFESKTKDRLQKLLKAYDPDPHVFLIALMHKHSESLKKENFTCKESELYDFLESFDESVSLLDKALALEQMSYLPNQNLLYTDKAAMHYGIEVRVPYLDHELCDYLYNVPSRFKLKGNTTKYLLRKIAVHYLPNSIIQRSKTGFSMI